MRRYTVRAAKPRDADGVTRLLGRSYPQLMNEAYPAEVLTPALEFMTTAKPALLATGTFWVAEAEPGIIVGCGGWTPADPSDGKLERGLGHIRHFGTDPDWVGCGIGRAIYYRCETQARESGITRFKCYSSLNAERFYMALGFRRVEIIEIKMAATVVLPSVLMLREI